MRLTLSKASTILALPAWTVMSVNAPGGPDWSAPVETSDETGVNLTIVTPPHRRQTPAKDLTYYCCCCWWSGDEEDAELRELLGDHVCSVARRDDRFYAACRDVASSVDHTLPLYPHSLRSTPR